MQRIDPPRPVDAAQRLQDVALRLRLHGPSRPAGDDFTAALDELSALAEELSAGQSAPGGQVYLEEVHAEAQTQRLRYQELFDFAPDGYLVTDSRGLIQEANHAAALLLRARKDFLVGKPLPFFVAAGWRSAFYARLGRLSPVSSVEHWETCFHPPHAQPRDVALTVTAFPGLEGRPAGYRWLLRDVTPRRRAEQALRAEKDFADSLVASVEAIVLVVGPEGRIVRSNPYLETASGYTMDELRDRDWCDLLPEVDRGPARGMVREALASGIGKGGALGLATRGGRVRAVAWSAKVLRSGNSEPEVVLLGQDVTDLQEAQEKALQAERLAAIGQMVAGLAHESRNALQRMQACLSVLGLRFRGQEEPLDLLDRLQKAQDDLHRLFNEVQAYAAPLRLEREVCDLSEVWKAAWADLAPLRQGREATLREELGGTDLRCAGSPFHLKQVFRNLLENALSMVVGPVTIRARCSEAELDGQEAVRVAVCDNGPGFKDDDRGKAFDPFFTTKVRGTGLGLAICKRIVEAHGGRIAVGAGGGPGAVLVVTLPRGKEEG